MKNHSNMTKRSCLSNIPNQQISWLGKLIGTIREGQKRNVLSLRYVGDLRKAVNLVGSINILKKIPKNLYHEPTSIFHALVPKL